MFRTELLVVLTIAAPTLLAANPPAVKQVLDEYEKSLSVVTKWSIEESLTGKWQWPNGTNLRRAHGTGRNKRLFYRDGDRYDLRTIHLELIGGDGLVEHGRADIECSRAIVDGWQLRYEQGHRFPAGYVFFRRDGLERLSTALQYFGGEMMCGYLADDQLSVLQFFRQAPEVLVRTDQRVDGHPVVELAATLKDHGKLAVYFDREIGSQPRRVELEKGGDDCFWDGRRMSDFGKFLPDGSRGPQHMVRLWYDVKSIGYEKIGGFQFPVACTIYKESNFEDGNLRKDWAEIKRDKVDFQPKFPDDVFKPKLPDGTPLINETDHDDVLIWQHGGPAPDPEAKNRMHR